MEFFECIESRRSCRSYMPDPVEPEKLARILEAARLAPTAANRQPFRILGIPTAGHESELRKAYDREWLVAAPLALLVCHVPAEGWVRKDGANYSDVDAAIVMEHIVLAANALGLGSCWIANFDAAALRLSFGLEEGWEPLALTPLGYPKEISQPRPRKDIQALYRALE